MIGRLRYNVGVLGFVVVAVIGVAVTAGCDRTSTRATAAPAITLTQLASPSPSVALSPSVGLSGSPSTASQVVSYPVSGEDEFREARRTGPVAGKTGRVLRYRVAVEEGITGIDPDQFGDEVFAILSDPRSWVGTGKWRLQQIGADEGADSSGDSGDSGSSGDSGDSDSSGDTSADDPDSGDADFTIYLVTPATRDTLCGDGFDQYTSCRNNDKVVLNVARWVTGVPNYGAGLDVYREYMVNHEVGHRLGNGHELCPGPGKPAPVMQQQTLGLHGCVQNAWPVRNGKEYHGRSGQYDDPIPSTP